MNLKASKIFVKETLIFKELLWGKTEYIYSEALGTKMQFSPKFETKYATIVELLRWRANQQPDKQAYIFMTNGNVEGASLSYGELDRQARAIAAQLQKSQVKGARVLLLYPQSLEFLAAFFGCLYAGAIAIPVPAPEASRLKRTLPRLQAIAKDAQGSFVLTTRGIISLVKQQSEPNPEFEAMHWLATEEVDLELAEDWQSPNITSDALAYLQYTSGSTSTPKGVAISHKNILFHCANLQKACGYGEDSVTVTWMPYFHDYGLVEGLLEPLYNGTPCYYMSPFSFIRRPFHWLQTISRYRATHSQAPNFAYEQCLRRITPEQKLELDLSSWQMAGNAAEPINPKVLESFIQTFAPCGFRPQAMCPAYGLAEATLLVSAGLSTEAPIILDLQPAALERGRVVKADDSEKVVRRLVGCGNLVGDTQVAIVNPQTLTRCASDEIGEIWVSDPSVAQGYWQRKEETDATFQAYITDTGEGPFLRTGDLGFIYDEQLFITSRIKDVIIIRGTNHYPQDIEWTVQESHPALRPENGAAFAVEVDGEERLVIAQEIERGYLRKLDTDKVMETIRRVVAEEHEIQIYAVLLLKPGTLPKTSSGKIQRSGCRRDWLNGDLNVVASWQSPVVNGTESVKSDRSFGLETNGASNGWHNSLYSTASIQSRKVDTTLNNSVKDSKAKTDELIQWLRGYANERVNSRLMDERRCIPPYIVLDLGNRGLLGLQVPEEQGGLALNNSDTMRIMEQLGAIDQSMALVVFNHNILGTRPILKYGQSLLQKELIPLLATGRELAAFAVSEPGAGSNPRGISTTAIPEGDGVWRLEGTKYWSGLAAWAGVINVFAQTLDHKGQPKGISGFAVRQGTPGLRQGPECMTLGMRGMIQNTIYLEGARVTENQLLGQVGRGMDAAQDAMMYGRLIIGAFGLGGMKRCAQLMLRYASRRSISTGRLLDNPVTLGRLGELNAKIAGLETLIARMTSLLDRGHVLPIEPYIVCKIAGAEFFWQATDSLIQLLGGRGYLENNIAPQLLRDARVCRIFEGPTETLNMYLGSRTLNQNEELHQFLSQGLNAPDIANNLQGVAAQIQERHLGSQSPFADRTTSMRWAAALAGEISTYAILLAVLKEAYSYSGSERLSRAMEWAQLNFDQKCKAALGGSPSEAILADGEVTSSIIANYTQTIGDLEQTLAGEDQGLDEFLRIERKENNQLRSEIAFSNADINSDEKARELNDFISPNSASLAETIAPIESDSLHNVESIQNWIINLLQQEWKIPVSSIDPSKSFADYGLDSVMAVNLAQELEDWLGWPVEATIVWNFPTIESLAHHLVSELQSQAKTKQTDKQQLGIDKPTTGEVLDVEGTPKDLDTLSEDEIAKLLAEEIAKVQ
ncbi:MAG: AMP-binding protein [Xenococcaceae cyanobacterium MO_234.B1]|nr:AMP-binding protein [Xenococcaceae cyanobacterium MO_234.B1]